MKTIIKGYFMSSKSISVNYSVTSSSASLIDSEYVSSIYKQDNIVNTQSKHPNTETTYTLASGKVINKKSVTRDEFKKINAALKRTF